MIKKLWKALVCWNFEPATDEDLESAGLAVTQAWSRRKDGKPGKGNELLADVARELHIFRGLPLFPQEEVADCLTSVDCVSVAGCSPTGASTFKWNTCVVADLQNLYAVKHRIHKVAVVAHPVHMGRAIWSYEKLGLIAIPADMPRELSRYQDPELIHPAFRYTWTIPLIYARELILRVVFILLGKI